MSYGFEYSSAAEASRSERAAFIRRVYAHVAGSVLAMMGLDYLLLQVVNPQVVLQYAFGAGFLVALLAFMAAGWIARVWAQSQTSAVVQYLGLALYIVAWALMFLPLLIIANHFDPKSIPTAGILTLTVFGGLTLSVFVTRKDYSFLGPVLSMCAMIALGVILASIFIGFGLGLLFCFAMVALISGYILYDTSNVMLHYRTDQHVAAALELFADVALLFWYILQIVMSSGRD